MKHGHGDPKGGYPRWVPPLVAIPPLFFGAVSVVGGGNAWWAVALAVGVAVVPWLVDAVRPGLVPPTLFVVWVVAPLAILNLAGGAVGVDLSGEGHSQFTIMLLLWLVGEMAARGTVTPLFLAGGASIAVILGRAVVEPTFQHSWPYWFGGVGIALVTGFMMRRQHQTLSELRAAQAALAGEAAQRERQRIAREVHDVVAHTLTVTLMHVSAARRALDRDPTAAREALVEAESLGRRSLADIRRTVGLLRAEDESPDTHALPDASDIPALLDSYRSAGTELHVETTGDLGALAPATGLTLYRIVQEAIANAVGHAPGCPVDVRLHVRRRAVEVVVSNPFGDEPDPGGGGLGLVGMRERVALLGGRLDAGQRDGRWTVAARLPLDDQVGDQVGTPA